MDINRSRRVESSSVKRDGRTSGAASASSVSGAKTLAPSDTSAEKTAASLTGSGPIAAVDAILALQGIEDSTDQRKQGVTHGEQLLKLLDDIRNGLLIGGIPRQILHRLSLATQRLR